MNKILSAPTDRRPRFLPDFCNGPAVIEILVIAELVAMVLVMARGLGTGVNVVQDFIGISLFMLWLALAAAAVLCVAGRQLAGASTRLAYLACYALLLLTTVAVSVGALWLDQWTRLGAVPDDRMLAFVGRNLSISAIVSAVALRYFHVQYQWRTQIRREAGARIEALQARIRPHFLFNTMNTIAALIPFAPADAEQAVEDLSELFRASLDDAAVLVSLDEEIGLAKLYQRLEEKRLGERLMVEWRMEPPAMDVQLPRLSIQPLLENAIHHGIERLAAGGVIVIEGRDTETGYDVRITNPVPPDAIASRGFHIALENIRERLALTLDAGATLATSHRGSYFEAVMSLPQVSKHAHSDR